MLLKTWYSYSILKLYLSSETDDFFFGEEQMKGFNVKVSGRIQFLFLATLFLVNLTQPARFIVLHHNFRYL